MDALTVTTPAGRRPHRHVAITLAVAVVAGFLLGILDFAAQKIFPYPWADLANSSAMWAEAAFAVGFCATREAWRAALSGVLLLAVAVESYYLTATLVQHDSPANLASPSALLWLLFAVVAGAIFGAAGNWSRYADGWLASTGTALAASVLCAEALVRIHRNPSQLHNRLEIALVEAAIAVTAVVVAGRTGRQRGLAALITVPLTALGFLAFTSFGYGG